MYENLIKNHSAKAEIEVKKTEMEAVVAVPTLHSQIGWNCLNVQNVTSNLMNDLVKFQLELTCHFGGNEHSVLNEEVLVKSES